MRKFTNTIRTQTGAAFVLLLMVVVVIMATTMITLATVNESNLQIMIARNIADKQTALRNADAAAGLEEQSWAGQVRTCFENIADCTLDFAPPYLGEHDVLSDYWSNGSLSSNGAMHYGTSVVEYMGKRPVVGDTERVIHFYRVSARASELPMQASGQMATDAKAPTVVQTMVRICARADGSGLC